MRPSKEQTWFTNSTRPSSPHLAAMPCTGRRAEHEEIKRGEGERGECWGSGREWRPEEEDSDGPSEADEWPADMGATVDQNQRTVASGVGISGFHSLGVSFRRFYC